MNEVRFRNAEHGGAEEAEIARLCELTRQAFADYVTDRADPLHAMALLMTALPMYAGTLFANLMFMGEVTQQDTARAAKMAAKNFRAGIQVGLVRATRVAERDGLMGTKQ